MLLTSAFRMLSFASSILSSNSLEFCSCCGVPSLSDRVYKDRSTQSTLSFISWHHFIPQNTLLPVDCGWCSCVPWLHGWPTSAPLYSDCAPLPCRSPSLSALPITGGKKNVTVPRPSPVTSCAFLLCVVRRGVPESYRVKLFTDKLLQMVQSLTHDNFKTQLHEPKVLLLSAFCWLIFLKLHKAGPSYWSPEFIFWWFGIIRVLLGHH